ncbi:hypothetical protein LRP88_03049 [Fusarium phalaenopsidis]
MAENRDIAFCFRGWAYDTGKVDRPKRRVIRISRAHDTRRAKDILSLNDTTDAGLVISPKEEDVEGVGRGLLAVVIGELLPAAEVPNHKELSKPAPLHSFDPDVHGLVETRPQTRLELWPNQFEVVGEDRINVSAVLELAKGLYAISDSGVTIHESLYRGVIVCFCTMVSNSYAVHGGEAEYHDNLIQSSIRIARGSAPDPMTARPLTQAVDANPGIALFEPLIRHEDAHNEHVTAWFDAGFQTYTHKGAPPGQLDKAIQLANAVLGTQNQEAIVTALGQVKRLALAFAFGMVIGAFSPDNENIEGLGPMLQAEVNVLAASVVEEFATQADQGSDAMDSQPTLPGLPANSAKLADKASILYDALGSVEEEGARNAVREAIRDYEEEENGEDAPDSPSTLGLPSNLDQKDAVLLRYMRQVFEKERDVPGSQDLSKELAWASRMDWK